MTAQVFKGDCLKVLDRIDPESVDLAYVDPPFFSQSIQRLSTRDGEKKFSFNDAWESRNSYAEFLFDRLEKTRSKLKKTGSIFFHCDKSASHISRLILEKVFGERNFQAEIIWTFRRWSNTKRGLLNSHQTIYFFSKTSAFKFFPIYRDYSPSTNVDQIMQKRIRDDRNKAVYARTDSGDIISNGAKRGVPLGDVWEIPFLNPKAKERIGYPTQKPILLLKQIMELTTEKGDIVLDPFCGSGTTLVAAQALERRSIGIDNLRDAVDLTRDRLRNPVVSVSALLEKGRAAYETHDRFAATHLAGLDYVPVHRNKGIDGVLKREINGVPVFLRVQRTTETQEQAGMALVAASKEKGKCMLIVIATKMELHTPKDDAGVFFINSANLILDKLETLGTKNR